MKNDGEANYPMASRSAASPLLSLLSDEVEWFAWAMEVQEEFGGVSVGIKRGA